MLLKFKKADNDMTSVKIVVEEKTRILFDKLSNAEEAPSERGLASEVVR